MDQTSHLKAKKQALMNWQNGLGNTVGRQKLLLKDSLYVIKIIDVQNLPEQEAIDALKEIELMYSLDSPYIVQYIDSFVENQMVNIIIEYCPSGDLNSTILKQ